VLFRLEVSGAMGDNFSTVPPPRPTPEIQFGADEVAERWLFGLF